MNSRGIIRKRLVLLGLAIIVAAVSKTAIAGDINGHVYSPFNMPVSEVSIAVNQDGDQAGCGQTTTWAAAPVGWYGFGTLPAGPYTMLLNEKDHWTRQILTGLQVPETGKIEVVVKKDCTDYPTGLTWIGKAATDYYQSFMATGKSINMVSLHQVAEPGPSYTISIQENDPNGKQIGPSRTIPTSINNPSGAFWSAGEVPTVPGKIYCVHLYVPGGAVPFLGGARIRGGNVFPDGHTWIGNKMIDTPVKILIGEDNDGIITTVSTQKSNSNTVPLVYHSVKVLGQTFTGNGSSVLTCSILCGSSGGKLIVSVHDGPGTNGEGGPQIGPAKIMKTIDWNNRSAVVWKPGEVPIQKGHVYYMKLRRPDGENFTIYTCAKDEYAGGNMYLDDKDSGTDISTTIACEEYPGSLNLQQLGITDVVVTRGSKAATITWKTSVPCDTSFVDLGSSTPYTQHKLVTSGNNSYSAKFVLSQNTLYHYRITAKAKGYRDARTADLVFVTNTNAQNLVKNPGFEAGDVSSWTAFGSGDKALRDFPASETKTWMGDSKAHGGKFFYGGVSNGGDCKGGVYQQVSVKAGRPLNARSWLYTWQDGGFGAFLTRTVTGRIGIDPKGGTDPKSEDVIWCAPVVAQDILGDGKSIWTEIATSVMPTGTKATIFLEAGADATLAWTVFGFDDVVATQENAAKK